MTAGPRSQYKIGPRSSAPPWDEEKDETAWTRYTVLEHRDQTATATTGCALLTAISRGMSDSSHCKL